MTINDLLGGAFTSPEPCFMKTIVHCHFIYFIIFVYIVLTKNKTWNDYTKYCSICI